MANKAVELLINLKTAGAKELDKLIKSVKSVDSTAKKASKGVDSFDDSLDDATRASRKLGKTAEQLDNEIKGAGKEARKAARGFNSYKKSVDKSTSTSKAITKTAKKMKGGMAGLAVAVASVVSAIAGLSVIKERSEEMRRMANAAERLGLSMEEFSAAEAAASQAAGLNWENLKDGMDDLNERIVDFAKNGAGEAADLFAAFEELDPDEMMNMNSLDQLKAVSEAMKDMSTQERSQLLDQLGSDNLRELTNVLGGANSEFFQMIENAKETGMTISDLESDRISSMGKDVSTLGRNFGILRDKFLARISPAIEVIVEHINNFIAGMQKSADEGGSMSRKILQGVEFIILAYNKWMGIQKLQQSLAGKVFGSIIMLIGKVVGAWDAAVNGVVNGAFATIEKGLRIAGKFNKKARQMADDIANYQPKQNGAGKAIQGMADQMLENSKKAYKKSKDYFTKEAPPLVASLDTKIDEEQATDEAKKAKDAVQKTLDRDPAELELKIKKAEILEGLELDLLRLTGHEAEAQMIELKNKYGAMLEELEGDSEGAELINKLIGIHEAKAELETFKSELDALRQAYEVGEISRDEFRESVDALTPKMNAIALKTENEEIIETIKEMTDEYKNMGDQAYEVGGVVGERFNGLIGGLDDVIMGTKSLGDAFHEMAMGIISDLIQMIIKQQIFNALKSAAGAGGPAGGFASAVLGSFGQSHGGGHVGTTSASRRVPESLFWGAPRYHTGGLIGSDEVPIIAQKGEYMLDKYDIRNPKNGGDGSTPKEQGGSSQAVNITNVVDSASIAGAMDTPDGHNAIINVIKANAGTVKSILR